MCSAPIPVLTPSTSSGTTQHGRQRSRSVNDAVQENVNESNQVPEGEEAASSCPNMETTTPARFLQANYECSFCAVEDPTFAGLLDHIKEEHPWYDLTPHENVK